MKTGASPTGEGTVTAYPVPANVASMAGRTNKATSRCNDRFPMFPLFFSDCWAPEGLRTSIPHPRYGGESLPDAAVPMATRQGRITVRQPGPESQATLQPRLRKRIFAGAGRRG